jgi:serine protease
VVRTRSRLLPAVLGLVLLTVPVAVTASPTVSITAVVRLADGSLTLDEHVVARSEVDALLVTLASDPSVLAAGPVHERTLVDTRTAGADPLEGSQWGWRRLGGERLSAVGDGAGLVVAVLDTGVDADHPDLSGRVLPGWDSMVENGDGRRDPNGHGTHVAGILAASAGNDEGIAGVAPGVSILPVRVLDATGNGDDDELALGIIWAVDHGADVMNLSIGGAVPSTLLEGAIDYALDAGVLVVVAAGNGGATGNEPSYPAAYPQVLAVGSTDSSDRRSIFSNTGTYVDIAAPGSWIVSTWPGGRYQTSSGTSMAAPFVTGAAALLQQRTGLEGRDLADRLVRDAIDMGVSGRDDEFGAGLVNPLAVIGEVPAPIPPGERSPVLPGLPSLPPLPDLPPLPELVPPQLPEVALPTLPPLPPLVMPELPRRPLPTPTVPLPAPGELPNVSPGVPSPPTVPVLDRPPGNVPSVRDVRPQVVVRVARVATVGRSVREIRVVLEGPRPLVARQRLIFSNGRFRREVVTDWNGVAQVRVPSSLRGVLRVEFPGSVSVRPASSEVRLPA